MNSNLGINVNKQVDQEEVDYNKYRKVGRKSRLDNKWRDKRQIDNKQEEPAYVPEYDEDCDE